MARLGTQVSMTLCMLGWGMHGYLQKPGLMLPTLLRVQSELLMARQPWLVFPHCPFMEWDHWW